MSEAFRIWFKFEICLFSIPVALLAVLPPLVLIEQKLSLAVSLVLVSLSLSCFLAMYAVGRLMFYSFGKSNKRSPKMIVLCLVYWLVNWVFVVVEMAGTQSWIVLLGFMLPIVVVPHLLFLSWGYFKSAPITD